ncbi:MAG: hypothetical protein ACYSX0_00325 [Planctomycetota bacterium]|jgi:hypothetical protein
MFREGLQPPSPFREVEPLREAMTQDGVSLKALSEMGPVLVVCLPALGSRFCRRMLRDLGARRDAIESAGVRVALVHMGEDSDAVAELEPLDLHYLARVADPDRKLYGHFGLKEATLAQRMGPRVWGTALKGGLLGGGRVVGNPAQLPGAFLLRNSEIERAHRCETMADAPELGGLF